MTSAFSHLDGAGKSIEQLAREHADFGRREVVVGHSRGADLVVYEKSPAARHISELHKLATQLKFKDWQGAIECLARAQTLGLAINSSLTLAQWLRLPKFLLDAGRGQEALAELRRLIQCRWQELGNPAHVATINELLAEVLDRLGRKDLARRADQRARRYERKAAASIREVDSAMRSRT